MSPPEPGADGLPRLLVGERRTLLGLLIGNGLSQAATAGVTAVALTSVFNGPSLGKRILLVCLLILAALAFGWLRSRERVLAERLSQHYVHEIRQALVAKVLRHGTSNSLGVTLARATNDLTAVRNWVVLGVAPLAVGVPLILGIAVVLALLHPALVAAVLVPLAIVAWLLKRQSEPVFESSRRVRRARGRLAAHLADTVMAATAIRSAGGEGRELRRLRDHSDRLVTSSVRRARSAGALRGTAAAGAGMVVAAVVLVATTFGLSGGTVAGAMIAVGLLGATVQELGRAVEYRQSFRAARRILVPALQDPAESADHQSGSVSPEQPQQVSGRARPPGGLVVSGLLLAPCGPGQPLCEVPDLEAHAGDRVVVVSSRPGRVRAVLEVLAGVRPAAGGQVLVDGTELLSSKPKQRRAMVGFAARGLQLERGTIARAVRYRVPECDERAVPRVLEHVGVAATVQALPQGQQTTLRHGGEPLAPPDRARVQLARAMLGAPPLIVLDHLDDELDEDGRLLLRTQFGSYPGIIIFASERAAFLASSPRTWDLD